MLVVKECCSNKEVCGKVEFLLSNWDVSSIARRGWPLVELIWMPLIAKKKQKKNNLSSGVALVNNIFP